MALGSIATLEQALIVLVGVIVTAGLGEVIRELRRGRTTPGERMAPSRSVLGERLHGG